MAAMAFFDAMAQNVIYVSADGKGLTIEEAQMKARSLDGPVAIFLDEGVYRLDKPLCFTAEDNGLTICALPGKHAVISGGIVLDLKWEPWKDGIYKAKVAQVDGIDMLVVNGLIRHQARYPNYDPEAVRFNGTSADATSSQRVRSWKHPEGAFLHAMHGSDWGDFHYRITGKNQDGTLQCEGGWQNNRQAPLHEQNRMVENVFEELDAPGEWYYNVDETTLYYYPDEGMDLALSVIETPKLKHLVEFHGSESSPVRDITIEGVQFTLAQRTFMEKYEPLLRSDWTVYRGAAIYLEGTENCHITNCHITNVGGNAVFFSNYNRQSGVEGCHFEQVGASAICFVGNPDAVRSPSFEYNEYVPLEQMDLTAGPIGSDFPSECFVSNNLVHHIGLFEKQTAGIELSMCSHITVSHNTIYHTPRAGINISEGTWGGHVIEWNDVFDTVRETGDHGSFNSWGRDRFWHPNRAVMDTLVGRHPQLVLLDAQSQTVLRHNRFRCDRGWDIDLDDGSSNYLIYGNLCLNGGLKLREGFNRQVENNIIVNNSFHPHVWFANSGDIFAHNIVMLDYKPIGMETWGAMVDYNVFADSCALRSALGYGVDTHSIVCPVRFVDPACGDYRVENVHELASSVGFHNFDMDRFGVISPELKALAEQPVFPTPIYVAAGSASMQWEWSGLTLKNLETLGERSATGMDSERGVYVIACSFSSPLRDYIKSNDVILSLNGQSTDNLKQLQQVVSSFDQPQPLTIQIFRNQASHTFTVPSTANH